MADDLLVADFLTAVLVITIRSVDFLSSLGFFKCTVLLWKDMCNHEDLGSRWRHLIGKHSNKQVKIKPRSVYTNLSIVQNEQP